MGKTLFDKVWEQHVVYGEVGEPQLLYIDRHYIHEVTSPQAFEGLKLSNRKVRQPKLTFGTVDHIIPTINPLNIEDEVAKLQYNALKKNCEAFGVDLADLEDERQGIIHVIGPELGLTRPGATVVCGDSHTATHGAFGAIAFGIGTSEVEHVLATQTLWQMKPKNLGIEIKGKLQKGVSSKDIILYILSKYGVSFGTGHVIEFFGETVRNMTMEERMTLCNMAIEGGAKAGMVAPDETTFAYLRSKIGGSEELEASINEWEQLYSDNDATFDQLLVVDVSNLSPYVTWGTNPGMGIAIDSQLPASETVEYQNAYRYMGLSPEMSLADIPITHVFIGSCTNSRLSDLQEAALVVKGQSVKMGVTALVVPGSKSVKKEAEALGLDKVFKDAGFEWREPGCSMCLAMNPDQVPAGAHCASTSNRNFEGRQGKGARTHLVSPQMAAAAALYGHFVDVRKEAAYETN